MVASRSTAIPTEARASTDDIYCVVTRELYAGVATNSFITFPLKQLMQITVSGNTFITPSVQLAEG